LHAYESAENETSRTRKVDPHTGRSYTMAHAPYKQAVHGGIAKTISRINRFECRKVAREGSTADSAKVELLAVQDRAQERGREQECAHVRTHARKRPKRQPFQINGSHCSGCFP
jgi:hypothetical protein